MGSKFKEIKKLTFNQSEASIKKNETLQSVEVILLNDKNLYCLDRCPNEFPYTDDTLLCTDSKNDNKQ
jgi:hypothetical protein